MLLPGIPPEALPSGFDAVVIALKSRSTPALAAVAQSLAACRALLASGASQIAVRDCSSFDSTPDGTVGQAGPGLVLSGSCSRATLAQVARYGQSHPSLALDDRVLTEPAVAREAALAFIDRHRDACPLIHSGADSAEVAARQARLGRDRIAHAFESFFAAIARAAIARVGKMPLPPFVRPGSPGIAPFVRKAAADHSALLLSNHGPVVSGATFRDAVLAAEELEETARLALLTRGQSLREIPAKDLAMLRRGRKPPLSRRPGPP